MLVTVGHMMGSRRHEPGEAGTPKIFVPSGGVLLGTVISTPVVQGPVITTDVLLALEIQTPLISQSGALVIPNVELGTVIPPATVAPAGEITTPDVLMGLSISEPAIVEALTVTPPNVLMGLVISEPMPVLNTGMALTTPGGEALETPALALIEVPGLQSDIDSTNVRLGVVISDPVVSQSSALDLPNVALATLVSVPTIGATIAPPDFELNVGISAPVVSQGSAIVVPNVALGTEIETPVPAGLTGINLAWEPQDDGTIVFNGDVTYGRGGSDLRVRDWEGNYVVTAAGTPALEGGRWTGSAWVNNDGSGNLLRPVVVRNASQSVISGYDEWREWADYRPRSSLNSTALALGEHYWHGEGADRRYYTVTTAGTLAASPPALSITIGETGISDGDTAVVTCSGYYTIEGVQFNQSMADLMIDTRLSQAGVWAATNATVGAVDADGMYLCTSTTNNSANRIERSNNITVALSSPYLISVDIKAGTAPSTRVASFQNGAFAFTQDITWSAGVPTIGSSTGVTAAWLKKRKAGIWRLHIRYTTAAADNTVFLTFYMDRSASSLNSYWGEPRMTPDGQPSNPVLATGTAITTNADTSAAPEAWINNAAGSAVLALTPRANAASIVANRTVLSLGSNILYFHAGNGGIQSSDGATDIGSTSPDVVRDTAKRVGVAWGTGRRLAEGGATVQTGTYDGSFGTGTTRFMCGPSGGAEFPGHLLAMMTVPTELSQTAIETLTSADD